MTQQTEQIDTAWSQQWYLTAPHRQINRKLAPDATASVLGDEPLELPFRIAHVRRVGAPFTACGKPAQHWPIFRLLDISEAEVICPRCANAVR